MGERQPPDPSGVVWVFHGSGGQFASGVFSARETAEEWIAMHRLSGLLTLYPVDQGAYEWAIANGYFKPYRADQTEAVFIQKFSCGAHHHHYENGVRVA